jgi:uncharacterized protein YodC (DUF2158 family)
MPKTETVIFEIGATVALKSGGPGLTVLGQAGERVHCVFFSDELGEFRETMLPLVALEAVDLADEEESDESEDEESAHTDDGDEDADNGRKVKAA